MFPGVTGDKSKLLSFYDMFPTKGRDNPCSFAPQSGAAPARNSVNFKSLAGEFSVYRNDCFDMI
jgi:hypothetical protein